MKSRRVVLGAVVAVAVVILGVVTVLVVRGGDDSGSAGGAALFIEPSTSPTPSPVATNSSCPDAVARSFVPATITVAGVARKVPVITPPRDSNNVPGIPPLSGNGKNVFAFDREQKVKPGDARGNVLLNAHTFPDGSALGNRLLDGLKRDGRIVVEGKKKGDQRLCYRVTKRVQVLATASVPQYYSRTGTPQLAIIVCSGRRLGPAEWEKRTIWYATPST